jgi:hypothetical protein
VRDREQRAVQMSLLDLNLHDVVRAVGSRGTVGLAATVALRLVHLVDVSHKANALLNARRPRCDS